MMRGVYLLLGILIVGTISSFLYGYMYGGATDVTKWTKNWMTTQPEYQQTEGEPELIAPEGATIYRNEKYNFKFAYPSELKLTENPGEGGFTAVFTNADGTKGFQIFVTPYVGWTITEERLKMDIPSGKVENPLEVLVDGTRATIFYSEHLGFGETREVWFIHGDYLYEVTAQKELDEWLSHIMTTWRFLKKPVNELVWQ